VSCGTLARTGRPSSHASGDNNGGRLQPPSSAVRAYAVDEEGTHSPDLSQFGSGGVPPSQPRTCHPARSANRVCISIQRRAVPASPGTAAQKPYPPSRGPGRVRAHAPKDRAVGSKIHWCHVSWIASLSIAVLEGGERQPPQDRYIAYRRPNLCVLFGDWPTPVFVVRIGKVSKPDRPSAGYRFRRCRQSLWLPDGEYHGR
jgi:hypothetical protein